MIVWFRYVEQQNVYNATMLAVPNGNHFDQPLRIWRRVLYKPIKNISFSSIVFASNIAGLL